MPYFRVEGAEILIALFEQLFPSLDQEIGLLEIVDDLFGAHDAREIECDAIRRAAFERKHAFGRRRHDTGAEDAQSCRRSFDVERRAPLRADGFSFPRPGVDVEAPDLVQGGESHAGRAGQGRARVGGIDALSGDDATAPDARHPVEE